MARNRFSNKFSSKKKRTPKLNIEPYRNFLPSRETFGSSNIPGDLRKGSKKDIIFYDEEVKKSVTNKDLRFSNYLKSDGQSEKCTVIENLSKDLNIIRDGEKSVDYNERALAVLSLYTSSDLLNIEFVMKSDIYDSLGVKSAVRVYWIYEQNENVIKIVCIDPQHLVIPSDHDGKDKNIVWDNTWNDLNQSKIHSIEQYFS